MEIAKGRSAVCRAAAATFLTALACAAGILAADADAAPQGPWLLPALDLSAAGQETENARIAIAPDGTATAVWSRTNGSNFIIQAAVRPPGGDFGPPEDLTAPGSDSFSPDVAAGPDGRATAVWVNEVGSESVVRTATSSPGGAFGPPTIASSPTGSARSPRIAIAGDGTATAAWIRDQGVDSIVQASTRLPGGGFGSVVDLTGPTGFSSGVEVAGSPDGTITAIWARDDGLTDAVQTATRPPAGNFAPDPVVGSPTLGKYADVGIAFGPDDSSVAVWKHSAGGNADVEFARRQANGIFGAPSVLASPGPGEVDPRVAVGTGGDATVVWQNEDGPDSIIQAREVPASGDPGPVVDLTDSGTVASEPTVVASPDGTITAAWSGTDQAENFRIQSRTRAPGGTFGATTNLSAAGQNAQEADLAAGPDGKVTAVWRRFDGSNSIVQAASTGPPPPAPCRLATLKLGSSKIDRKRGTATLKVRTGAAGRITLKGRSVRTVRRATRNAGLLSLPVKATGKAARQLRRSGKSKLKLSVVFEPNDCPVRRKSTTVKLVRR